MSRWAGLPPWRWPPLAPPSRMRRVLRFFTGLRHQEQPPLCGWAERLKIGWCGKLVRLACPRSSACPGNKPRMWGKLWGPATMPLRDMMPPSCRGMEVWLMSLCVALLPKV